MPATDTDAPRRKALGDAIRQTRIRRGWTVADAAKMTACAPMTLRRVEAGQAVRDRVYEALDGVLSIEPGTVKLALLDDARMSALLATLGVDTPAPPPAPATDEPTTAELTAALIARVAAEDDVAPTLRSRVTGSLAALLSALAGTTTATVQPIRRDGEPW